MTRAALALGLALTFCAPVSLAAEEPAQDYEIARGASRVGFVGESTLHDFTGTTAEVSGRITAWLAAPAELCRGRIEAAAASLDTGNRSRDRDMRRLLEVEAHPSIAFALERLDGARRDPATGTIEGEATGLMTIRGVTRPFSLPVRVTPLAGGALAIRGEGPLDMTAYGIKPPRVMGFIRVAPEVKITIELEARPVRRAGTERPAG